jgi:hypothetical protein
VGLTINHPSPKLTIFFTTLSLVQVTTIHSPRDQPGTADAITHRRVFPVLEQGQPVSRAIVNPGPEHPAMWRGVEAQGKDHREETLVGTGSLPIDSIGRPTTLEGFDTPLRNTHTLVYKVYFSVWGEDGYGATLPNDGPGQLRVLSMPTSVIVPSCAINPGLHDVPPCEYNRIHKTDHQLATSPIFLTCNLRPS